MSFGEGIAEWLDVLPAPLAVFLLALSPVGEVRLAIPVGIIAYGMGWAEAFTWALLGNLLVVPLGLAFYRALERVLRKWGWADRRLDRLYARTQQKHSERIEKGQEYAVFGFIATPVPGTGAWSGTLVAHVFGLTARKAAPYYYAGIVVACFLVVLFVEAGLWGFNSL